MNTEATSNSKIPNFVLIVTLIVSIVGNGIQYHQNSITNARADREELRADRQERRANDLQGIKEQYILDLKNQAQFLNDKINSLLEENKVLEIGVTLSNFNDRAKAQSHLQINNAELESLQQQKTDVEKKIADFMSK